MSSDPYRKAWSAGTSCQPQKHLRKPRERCTYCQRYTFKGPQVTSRQRTRDHLVPLSKGGKRPEWVIACNKCNQLRSDLPLDDWLAFIARYPKWWLDFRTHKDVLKAIARYSLLTASREAQSDDSMIPSSSYLGSNRGCDKAWAIALRAPSPLGRARALFHGLGPTGECQLSRCGG